MKLKKMMKNTVCLNDGNPGNPNTAIVSVFGTKNVDYWLIFSDNIRQADPNFNYISIWDK